ncbi:hypothetical protein SEA_NECROPHOXINUS_8 [Microbacterium phage Necrophoxinus]|nr:hypothetical protein SEA_NECROPHOXINUS_8 [Microbacterium phage Necrophoxinus]
MSLTISPLAPVSPAYVQVNIGRNVGGIRMPASKWSRFRGEVESTLFNSIIGRGIVSEHVGAGAWLSENGNTVESEESAYLSTFAVVDLDALRTALASLRVKYGQDAIALIVGSELI